MEAPVKLRFIPYNARLIDARKAKGLTQKNMAQLTGLDTSYVGHVETLRIIPSQAIMDEIADALNLSRDYLFPESLLAAVHDGLFDRRVVELEEEQIIRLTESRRAGQLPPHITDDEMIDLADSTLLKEQIAEILDDGFTPREKEVLELRFGLKGGLSYTLAEISRGFNVSRECVRQIEVAALRKLRRPQYARKLERYI